jgi:hypothetical protein
VYAHTDEHGTILQPNAQPGDIRFKELNHDGVLDENDKTYIGNAYPDLMAGLNLGLNYKSFDFNANFYGTFVTTFSTPPRDSIPDPTVATCMPGR